MEIICNDEDEYGKCQLKAIWYCMECGYHLCYHHIRGHDELFDKDGKQTHRDIKHIVRITTY